MPDGTAAKPARGPADKPARRVWRLSSLGGPVEVVRAEDVYAFEKTEVFTPALLDRAIRDPVSQRALLEMYQYVGGHLATGGRAISEKDLRGYVQPALDRAFRRGYFVILARRAADWAETQDQAQEQKTEKPPPPPPKRQPEKTWIEIQLVDQEGNPVPNERYRLKITDGSVREGRLDAKGTVRVSGLEPGNCTVWFPNIDAKEWKRA